jgi:hypothetical protein
MELNSTSGRTRADPPEHYQIRTESGSVRCSLRTIRHEGGTTWERARALLAEVEKSDSRSGFYVAANGAFKAKSVILAIREAANEYRISKPNHGRQLKKETYDELICKYDKVSKDKAERLWRFIYDGTDTQCIHMCLSNRCKTIENGKECNTGIRHRLYCSLSGGILTAWPYLEYKVPDATRKIRIIRLRLEDNVGIIGPNIPQDCIDKVKIALTNAQINKIVFKPRPNTRSQMFNVWNKPAAHYY